MASPRADTASCSNSDTDGDGDSDNDTHCADPVSDEALAAPVPCIHYEWVDQYTGERVPAPPRSVYLSMLSAGYSGPVARRVTQPARCVGHAYVPQDDSDDEATVRVQPCNVWTLHRETDPVTNADDYAVVRATAEVRANVNAVMAQAPPPRPTAAEMEMLARIALHRRDGETVVIDESAYLPSMAVRRTEDGVVSVVRGLAPHYERFPEAD